MSTTNSFNVTVNEVNEPPVLADVTLGNVIETHAGVTIRVDVDAYDTDLPSQQLTYSLLYDVPAGASIDPASGLITWEVPAWFAHGSYDVYVEVVDNGAPAKSANMVISFLGESVLAVTNFTAAPAPALTFPSVAGWDYELWYSTDATNWSFGEALSAGGDSTTGGAGLPAEEDWTLYRVDWIPDW